LQVAGRFIDESLQQWFIPAPITNLDCSCIIYHIKLGIIKSKRRDFLKLTGTAGIGLAGAGIMPAWALNQDNKRRPNKVTVEHARATLEDGSVLATPYWRIESGRDGPSFLLVAAQHGNEVQGVEVARRFQEICARQLIAGSVWIIPMAELRGIRLRRYTPESLPEKRVADKAFHLSWPGDPGGNDTERIAYALDQAVLRHCSHLVDIHCWTHPRAAETLSQKDHAPSYAMGQVTTTRFISYRNSVIPQSGNMSISKLMLKRGGSSVLMELSGQYQMQEKQVQIGLSSMVNISKMLGMIDGTAEKIDGPTVEHSPEASHEVKAPSSGIFMPALRKDKTATLIPDDYVYEGQSLGHIISDNDLADVPVNAPVSGYLWQYGLCHWNLCDASLSAQHPYAEMGETIAIVVNV